MAKRQFKRRLAKEYKLRILLSVIFTLLAIISWHYQAPYPLIIIISIGAIGFFALAMTTKKYD